MLVYPNGNSPDLVLKSGADVTVTGRNWRPVWLHYYRAVTATVRDVTPYNFWLGRPSTTWCLKCGAALRPVNLAIRGLSKETTS
jgi:hypothetical protein